MGLLDALALADALADNPEIDEALRAYAAARRRHIRFYQAASWWLTPLFQSNSRAVALLRDLAFPLLAGLPYFRRESVRSLAGLEDGIADQHRARGSAGTSTGRSVVDELRKASGQPAPFS